MGVSYFVVAFGLLTLKRSDIQGRRHFCQVSHRKMGVLTGIVCQIDPADLDLTDLCLPSFLLQLAGAGLLICGLWLHFDHDVITYFKIMETALSGPLLQTVAYLLMGTGGFLLLIGFLGCCGACCESMCLLCLVSALQQIAYLLLQRLIVEA